MIGRTEVVVGAAGVVVDAILKTVEAGAVEVPNPIAPIMHIN